MSQWNTHLQMRRILGTLEVARLEPWKHGVRAEVVSEIRSQCIAQQPWFSSSTRKFVLNTQELVRNHPLWSPPEQVVELINGMEGNPPPVVVQMPLSEYNVTAGVLLLKAAFPQSYFWPRDHKIDALAVWMGVSYERLVTCYRDLKIGYISGEAVKFLDRRSKKTVQDFDEAAKVVMVDHGVASRDWSYTRKLREISKQAGLSPGYFYQHIRAHPKFVRNLSSGLAAFIGRPQRNISKLIPKEEWEEVFSGLDPRQRDVLLDYYSLFPGGTAPNTEEAIAARLGISKSGVHQIKQKALKRLRHPSRRRKLGALLRQIKESNPLNEHSEAYITILSGILTEQEHAVMVRFLGLVDGIPRPMTVANEELGFPRGVNEGLAMIKIREAPRSRRLGTLIRILEESYSYFDQIRCFVSFLRVLRDDWLEWFGNLGDVDHP